MGMKFRSGFEKRLYEDAQGPVEYEPKDGHLSYNMPRVYIPDFVIKDNGIRIEAKGYFPSADRTKLLRVRKDNPGVDIRLVFQRASNRLTKSPNSMTYAQWADRNGFEWAEGNIPEEWFREKPNNGSKTDLDHPRRRRTSRVHGKGK